MHKNRKPHLAHHITREYHAQRYVMASKEIYPATSKEHAKRTDSVASPKHYLYLRRTWSLVDDDEAKEEIGLVKVVAFAESWCRV